MFCSDGYVKMAVGDQMDGVAAQSSFLLSFFPPKSSFKPLRIVCFISFIKPRNLLIIMLPYTTIEEAEAAIGRHLTTMETIWFNYSANKSDYFLCCHIIFFSLICSFYPLYYTFLEFMAGDSLKSYKIQPKVILSFSQIFSCYKSAMLTFMLVLFPLQLTTYSTVKMIGITTSLPLSSIWKIIAQLVVYFLVEDYTHYWMHRFLHCKWCYDKIHRVHHEYTAPVSFAAPHAHWAEHLILGIPSLLGPAIVPCHIITFWMWLVLRQVEALDIHSGYDLPWTITKFIPFYGGADYHDYHHYVGGLSQSNFASVFTYCDYIYGTNKGYRYQKRVLQQLQQEMKSKGDQAGVSH